MRSFAECKKIFDLIKPITLEDSCLTAERVAVRTKWFATIAKLLYPEYVDNFNDYYLDSQGVLMEGSCSMEDSGEYIVQSALGQSYIEYYAHVYMEHSPYWSTQIEWSGMGDSTYDSENGTYEGEEDLYFTDFLKSRFGSFLEERLYEKPQEELFAHEHPLYKLYGMFDNYEVADDICAVRSALYPYVGKAKKVAGKTYSEHISYIYKAYEVVESWLGINHCIVETDTYGYFFATDDSASAAEGMGCGALCFYPEIIICAELIEAAMFEIHKEFPFLPERIVLMGKGGGGND